jgi:hypothetical protein
VFDRPSFNVVKEIEALGSETGAPRDQCYKTVLSVIYGFP